MKALNTLRRWAACAVLAVAAYAGISSPAFAYYANLIQASTGAQLISVPFPYIAQADVSVTVGGVAAPFTWISAGQIHLTNVPPVPATIQVQRTTTQSALLVGFATGSLDPSDLNLEATQLLYLIQEATDQLTLSGSTASGLAAQVAALAASSTSQAAAIAQLQTLVATLGAVVSPDLDPTGPPWLAKGDGVTDDTAAWQALFAACQASNGCNIKSPPGKTYLTFSQGQATVPLGTLSALPYVKIDMQHSSFVDAHVFPPTNGATVTAVGTDVDAVSCLLTVPSAGFDEGAVVGVAGIVGPTACNGSFAAHIVDSTHIKLTGTTRGVTAYSSGGLVSFTKQQSFLLLQNGTSNVYIPNGWHVTQSHPTVFPVAFIDGVIGIAVATGGHHLVWDGVTMVGGVAPFEINGVPTDKFSASTRDVTINGCESTNSLYGAVFANSVDGARGSCKSSNVDRSSYFYGSRDIEWLDENDRPNANGVIIACSPSDVAITGAVSSTGSPGGLVRLTIPTLGMTTGDSIDVLGLVETTEGNGAHTITVIDSTHLDLQGTSFANAYVTVAGRGVDTNIVRPTENIKLDYHVIGAPTAGWVADSYLTFDPGCAGSFAGGHRHGIIRNVSVKLRLNLKNDATNSGPAIQNLKGTTLALASVMTGIDVSGYIAEGPQTGNVVDWNSAADSAWTSETQSDIRLHDLTIDGPGTSTFRIDYGGCAVIGAGCLIMENIRSPGTITEVNPLYNATVLTASNLNFSGKTWGIASTNGGIFGPCTTQAYVLVVCATAGGGSASFSQNTAGQINALYFVTGNSGSGFGTLLEFLDGATHSADLRTISAGGMDLLSLATIALHINSSAQVSAPVQFSSPIIKLGSTSLTAVSTAAPGQIPGEPGAGAASAGNAGELMQSSVLGGAALSLVNATAKTITSQAFTAGDWDIYACGYFAAGASTTVTALITSISNATNTTVLSPMWFGEELYPAGSVLGAQNSSICAGPLDVHFTTPTTYYLVAQANFGTSTMVAYGTIRGRRVR